MDNSWVKLYRKSINNEWLKNHKLWAFWCYCLMKATHMEHTVKVGYQDVLLKPGQFVFGRKMASKETGLSEQTIRTCLNSLSKRKNLTIKTTNKFSIISICNWETYQGGDNNKPTNKLTNQQPTTNQQLTTYKNVKKGKNGKNDIKEREQKFRDQLKPFINNPYPVEMIESFYNYWTEPNKSGTQMKFEMQSTWELKRRLNTWDRRSKEMRGQKNEKRSSDEIKQSARDRLKRVFGEDDI